VMSQTSPAPSPVRNVLPEANRNPAA
jgi:hypothetical protein